ncbi:MAG: hypothetical protein HKP61_21015 [Dactylosporangium sp.]|nr:hypothetical protein [Dactylosporangium sp.]NNJ63362.1 hypothetical protein [Dactylosporangium sp.]
MPDIDNGDLVVVAPTSAASLWPTAGAGAVADELDVLRLRVEAALTMIPLISRVVPDHAGRRAVVANVVDRWLALPLGVRERHRQAGGSDGCGLERFGWDFVDAVEQGMYPHSADGRAAAAEVVEQVVFGRWRRYLETGISVHDHAVRRAA